MEEKARILYVVQEMVPFLELTSISNFIRKLPQAIQEKGIEIRIFMPRFGCINERKNRLHEVIRLSGMNIVVNDTDNQLIIKVASIPQARMQVYFLDNEDYFNRKHAFGNGTNKMFKDNDERMLFFCKGVLETVKKLGWMPNIIHCHDWMTSLVPLLLKTKYLDDPMYSEAKVIYSVYENSFVGNISSDLEKIIRIDGIPATESKFYKEPNNTNLHNAAIHYADAIIRGSQTLNPKVESFLNTQTKKQVLDYYDESASVDIYYNFYNELLEEQKMVLVN